MRSPIQQLSWAAQIEQAARTFNEAVREGLKAGLHVRAACCNPMEYAEASRSIWLEVQVFGLLAGKGAAPERPGT